jgi:hypothetical protein
MIRPTICTSHDAKDVAAALAVIDDVARALDGSKLLKTRADGQVRKGIETPVNRLSRFWYLNGAVTVTLHHETNHRLTFGIEDASGTREVSVNDLLPTGMSRADCMDPTPASAALHALHAALEDHGPTIDRTGMVDLMSRTAEAVTEARPEGIMRNISIRAATPFTGPTIAGINEKGRSAVRETPSARRLLLERFGRPVLLVKADGQRTRWVLHRMTVVPRSATPDPLARLRLLADTEIGAHLFDHFRRDEED